MSAADEIGPARGARRARRRSTPPQRPVYVEVPTDLLDAAAEARPARSRPPRSPARPGRAAVARGRRARSTARRGAALWVGGGARAVRRGRGGGAPGRAAGGAGDPHLRGARPAAARPPLPGARAPARARGGRALGRGRPGAGHRQRPRRDDDPGLGDARPAATRGGERRRRATPARTTAPTSLLEADAAPALDALAGAVAERPGLERPGRRLGGLDAAALDGVEAQRSGGGRVPRARSTARFRDDAIVVCDMCIPGYWLGGFRNPARAAQALVPARLGHARLRLPAGARRGPGGPRAGA